MRRHRKPLALSLSKGERPKKGGCNASTAAVRTNTWKVATHDFSYVSKHLSRSKPSLLAVYL